jgi:CDP-diglyceride synthetase
MMIDRAGVPLARLVISFSFLLIIGIAITLPLFRFDFRKFVRTSLFVKIMFWIPIFLVFVAALYMTQSFRILLVLALIILGLCEALIIGRQKGRWPAIIFYFLVFSIALLHFYILDIAYPGEIIRLLVIIGFASVLSDVTAFFLGNYLGVHKLPTVLNPKKSWEGVLGQILGAFIGVIVVNTFIIRVPSVLLFIPIGLGAAAGDLFNSFIKRKVGIKDWGNTIPGHGGYLDRLSSLSGSAALTFYFLKFTGVI